MRLVTYHIMVGDRLLLYYIVLLLVSASCKKDPEKPVSVAAAVATVEVTAMGSTVYTAVNLRKRGVP